MDKELLYKALHDHKNSSLLKYTLKKIQEIKKLVINDLPITKKEKTDYLKDLKEYRYISDLEEIKEGSYIRWFNEKNIAYLTLGGFIINTTFKDTGVLLCIKGLTNKLFYVKFDECTIFQKMREEEKILLMTLDYIEKE
jgi:hypothetical protein